MIDVNNFVFNSTVSCLAKFSCIEYSFVLTVKLMVLSEQENEMLLSGVYWCQVSGID